MKPMNSLALGGMEVILGQDTYQTTLANRDRVYCYQAFQERSMRNGFIQIRKLFAWRQSLPVLPCWRKSGGTVCTCFLEGADRLAVLFRNGSKNITKMTFYASAKSRQNMADETGLLKSISRAIKKFQSRTADREKRQSDSVSTGKQYERLKRTVDEKIGNV